MKTLIRCFLLGVLLLTNAVIAVADDPAPISPYWEAVAQQGDVPPPIWETGASFARAPKGSEIVYRFGGQTGSFPSDFARDDFYALDLATGHWTQLTMPEGPEARADAMMTPGPCGQCVSVAGGRGRFRTGTDIMFPNMWTYHVASGRWKEVRDQHLGDPFALRRSSAPVITVTDPEPPFETVHYAFGGVGNTLPSFPTTPTGLRNDLAVYEKNTGWSVVATFGDHPVPRGWSAGEYDPTNHAILIFGGYRLGPDQGPETPPFLLFGPTNYEDDLWSLDLVTMTWTELEPAGPRPSPRDNARGFFDTSRGAWVLFGGQAFDGPLNDLWLYSVADNEWTEVELAAGSPVPPARVGAVHFVRETETAFELYIHGGATADGGSSTLLDDLWKLTWPKLEPTD